MRSGDLDRDIVDQPGLSDFSGDQNPQRSVLDRGDRRERFGVPGLEIIHRKPAAVISSTPPAIAASKVVARAQAAGAFLHGAKQNGAARRSSGDR